MGDFFYQLFRGLERELNINRHCDKLIVRAFFPSLMPSFRSRDTLVLSCPEIAAQTKISDSWVRACLLRLEAKNILCIARERVKGYRLYKFTPEMRQRIDVLLASK